MPKKVYKKTLTMTPSVGKKVEQKDGGYKTSTVHSVSADQVGGGGGLRYYSGEGESQRLNMSGMKASMRARHKMASTPSDSIRSGDVDAYLEPPKKKKKKFSIFGK